MKSKRWLRLLWLVLPLCLVCGFLWSPEQMGRAAAIGGGLGLLLILGMTFAPNANQTVYFNTRTGKRVFKDGSPNPYWTDDIPRRPGCLGALNFVAGYIAKGAVAVAMCAGVAMVLCGAYGAIMLVASIGR